MVAAPADCVACKQPFSELFFDKRYKHSICRNCFIDRRDKAARALDSDWFLANIPFDQFSENEMERTGIRSLAEYEKALEPAEPDGTEGDSRMVRKVRTKQG